MMTIKKQIILKIEIITKTMPYIVCLNKLLNVRNVFKSSLKMVQVNKGNTK